MGPGAGTPPAHPHPARRGSEPSAAKRDKPPWPPWPAEQSRAAPRRRAAGS